MDKSNKAEPELTDYQKGAVRELKEAELEIREMLDRAEAAGTGGNQRRWIALARTHVETGFMFAVKAVTNGRGV